METKMKICPECLRPFEEWQDLEYNPLCKLGEIFLRSTGRTNDVDLCPECRQKMGMLNLMGFRK